MKIKFSLVFFLFSVLLFSVIILNSARQIGQAATIMVSSAGMPVLERAAATIDGDKYELLTQTLDDNDSFFIETQSIFRELKNETQCLYLYSMARYEDGVHRFIFDGEAPDTENYTHIGMIEDVSAYDRTYLLTYETGLPQFTPTMHQLNWGRLISAYMPILNSDGEVVGVIGVDFQGEEIYRTIMGNLWQQVIFALIFIKVGIFLYFLFSKDLSQQNERLSRLYRAKMDFLQDINHEVKNPLTVIATGIDYIDRQLDDEAADSQKTRFALEKIRSETQRLGRMVAGMVYLSAMSDSAENRERVNFASFFESDTPPPPRRGEREHPAYRFCAESA